MNKKSDSKITELSFRTSIGGFNKSDVIKYISEMNRRLAERREVLEQRTSEAEAKVSASAAELSETRAYFLSVVEKKDEEIAALTKEIADIKETESDAVVENEQLKAMLQDCQARLKNYSEQLAAIEASHKENIAAIEKERERSYSLHTENEELRDRCAAMGTEMEELRRSSVISEDISILIDEIRERFSSLDEKIAAHKKLTESFTGYSSQSDSSDEDQ